MAQDERNSGGNVPVAGIVALMLFASGLFVQHQPLQSSRPTVEVKAPAYERFGQDVEARLWQDPLDAVRRTEKQLREQSAGRIPAEEGGMRKRSRAPGDLKQLIEKTEKAGGSTLVLPVMIYGGPYAEDAEERRRSRYAVLAALRAAEFEPENSRGIGFVRLPAGAAHLDGLVVPFEHWRAIKGEGHRWNDVFILWLTEERFSDDPATKLRALYRQVIPRSPKLVVEMLGPAGSDTAEKLWNRRGRCQVDGSGRAHVGEDCLKFTAPLLTNPRGTAAAVRVSPAERRLAEVLVDELVNRDLSLPGGSAYPTAACDDHVALVVEADTHYGRGLESQFRNLLLACGDNVHVFRYFRGLDGKVAQAADEAKKSGDGPRDDAKQESTAPQERAQGQGQFDYLLRVAAAVREKDDELEHGVRQSGGLFNFHRKGRSIRAVVILGSDIHDKLAILQALRERLPQALFATTDLDAGLLQADQVAWTRNVIIASGYGLKLSESLQAGAAPFRDTYQTATYLAARRVLVGDDAAIKHELNRGRNWPKLFEVGNGVAVELTRIDGDPEHWERGGSMGRIVAGIALLGAFGLAYSWCLRRLVASSWFLLVVAAALAIACYVVRMLVIVGQPGEEPLRWLEGVSIWPSELIRFGVGLLGVAMFFLCRHKLNQGDGVVNREFFRDDAARPTPHGGAGFDERLKNWLARWFPSADSAAAGRQLDVTELWRSYKDWTHPLRSGVRVSVGLVLYFALAALFIALDPPVVPVRGALSRCLDQWTVGFAVLAMLFVLIAILDRVALCTLFLRRLYGIDNTAQASNWDGATLHRFCGTTASNNAVADDAARSYVDLRLSARLTQFVGQIVLYPFVLSLLLILARSRYIDNWVMPRGLIVVLVLGLALVVVSAMALRHYAERIRAYTVDQLTQRELILRAAETGATPAGTTPEQVALMRQIATGLREGAFAPMSEQPIIRALILPFGGAGLVSLLDYGLLMNW